MKCVSMKSVVVHGALDMYATQEGSFEVSMTPAGIGMISYPWKLPVIPGDTMPPSYGVLLLHAPGLIGVADGSPVGAGVTKVPSLNCSTTTIEPD